MCVDIVRLFVAPNRICPIDRDIRAEQVQEDLYSDGSAHDGGKPHCQLDDQGQTLGQVQKRFRNRHCVGLNH